MELSKQSYVDTVNMPVKKLYDYLKWKTELEESKQKEMEENAGK